jgi:hypothetical protein
MDSIVDNTNEEDLAEEMVFLLGKFTHNREFLPSNYINKFELNRLNFTYHGALE